MEINSPKNTELITQLRKKSSNEIKENIAFKNKKVFE